MIPIKLSDIPHPLRSNWNEVTFSFYCEIVKAKDRPLNERLSLYSGIPIETINKLKLSQLVLLSDILEWMDEPDTVMAFAEGYESELTIGEQPYWKVEKAKQILKDNPYPITSGAELVELYTGDKDGNGGIKISDEPVTKVIGMAAFFLTSCQSSSKDSRG